MRTVFRNHLLAAGAILLSTFVVDAQEGGSQSIGVSKGYEEAYERYGSEAVEAIQVNGPNQFTPITLVDLTTLGLEVRYPGINSSITLPEEDLTFSVGYNPQLDTQKYATLISEGNRGEATELLRMEVYPLLKFVPLDPQKVRIHSLVNRLLTQLLEEDRIAESATIVEGFPRSRLTTLFQDQAVEIATALVEEGDVERAYDLIKKFPLGPGDQRFATVYLDLANEFRLREDWEKSRNLYKDVQLASSPEDIPEAFLWEAYIHLQEDRPFMVSGILQQFDQVDSQSPYYSLFQLVQGVVLSGEGKMSEALSTFAKGLVYSTTNDPWTPELLFRTAELYEAEDFISAASEVRYQLQFFYPESIWVSRLEKNDT